ncbi:ROK family protein [Microbacterium saccharophilum]|uniref:ROK family protein n=1 Tax=Microbacterium saccharophilum TaxID=1213358 RepID=A0A5C8HVA5_9MICO|nr:ROK family protein [Microbacterium saccharophilum]TXK09188.1 ROK family protein [Microbacterium saccharophilum]GEP47630.1 NagC family transcriptional regulator [Microbacterium saccharophilum]
MRVGIDIGGTKTVGVLLNDPAGGEVAAGAAAGQVAQTFRMPTGHGNAQVTATALAVVEELLHRSGLPAEAVTSIGVGVPGVVDGDSGEVSHAVNLGVTRLPLRRELARRFPGRITVENDVNAAAVGVWHLLAEPGIESMAYLNLGTGLAAGLVLDGRLRRGARGTAGEIGHIPVEPGGPLCACGQRGCLELSASGAAIARLWPGKGPRALAGLIAAADAGDPVAVFARGKLVDNIAAAVRLLVLTVDVDVVVIGGGMISQGSPLIAAVRAVLDEWGTRSAFIDSLELSARVRYAPSASAVAAIGAAHLAVASGVSG